MLKERARINKNFYDEMKSETLKMKSDNAIRNSILNVGLDEVALNHKSKTDMHHTFSLELKTGKITSQNKSGRCWLFAGLNTMRFKIMKELNLKNFELEKWEIMQLNRDEQELNVIFVANCFDQFRKVSNLKVIQPVIFNIPPFEDPDLRKNPVRINFPINKSDSIVYELPFIDKYEVELTNDSFETRYIDTLGWVEN